MLICRKICQKSGNLIFCEIKKIPSIKKHWRPCFENTNQIIMKNTSSPRQYTIPRLFTDWRVPLPFNSWCNGSLETSFCFMKIWCSKDLRSLLFWNRQELDRYLWHVMFGHAWMQPMLLIYFFFTENNIRNIENWSLWRILSICNIKFMEINDKLLSLCKWSVNRQCTYCSGTIFTILDRTVYLFINIVL